MLPGWDDPSRIGSLAATTARLVVGVLLIDLPLGTASRCFSIAAISGAVHSSAHVGRGKSLCATATVDVGLAVGPRRAGWLGPPNPSWPWATGLPVAIWVHAAAGLPWVVWLGGPGPPLGRTGSRRGRVAGGWAVVRAPAGDSSQGRGAVFAAATWVALLTAHEITVTDLTQVGPLPKRFTLSSPYPT